MLHLILCFLWFSFLYPPDPDPSSLLTPSLCGHSRFPLSVFAFSCVSSLALDLSASSVSCVCNSHTWLPRAPFSAKIPWLTSGLLSSFQENSIQLLCCTSFPSCASQALFAHRGSWFPPWKEPRGSFQGRQSSSSQSLWDVWALETFVHPLLVDGASGVNAFSAACGPWPFTGPVLGVLWSPPCRWACLSGCDGLLYPTAQPDCLPALNPEFSRCPGSPCASAFTCMCSHIDSFPKRINEISGNK